MNLSVLSFAESNTLIIDVPKDKLESIERQTMENIIENEKKLAPEYEYKYVKVGSQTKTKVKKSIGTVLFDSLLIFPIDFNIGGSSTRSNLFDVSLFQ